MTKVNRGISIDPVLTRRSMVFLDGHHGSNCHHRYETLCIERPVETQFDPNGQSLPDATNDQGLCGHAYLDPCYVEYEWELGTTTSFFIVKPQVTYTKTNTDGSLFDSGFLLCNGRHGYP